MFVYKLELEIKNERGELGVQTLHVTAKDFITVINSVNKELVKDGVELRSIQKVAFISRQIEDEVVGDAEVEPELVDE